MTSVCFYFQVHQPFRLKPYSYFDIAYDHVYEDDHKNREIMNKVAEKCYLPANRKMLELIDRYEGKFKISFSISGTALEQFEKYRPDVLQSFQKLVSTNCVELLSETYYHSLSFLFSENEFIRQVEKHKRKIQSLFKVTPQVFRNTELIYNNHLADFVHKLGFKGILAEGVENLLNGRSPNFLYCPPNNSKIITLLINYKFSDDIAFRFSNKSWKEHPLTANKFSHWIHQIAGAGELVNLFMDYETFGEHQWADTGIFDFLDHLPNYILSHPDFDFKTPSELIDTYPVRGIYDAHNYTSWADTERDLSAWLGNELQNETTRRIYALEQRVKKINDDALTDIWSKLLTSDHFYYMSTKNWEDGNVHKYFSPYDSPFKAYNYYTTIINDFELLLEAKGSVKNKLPFQTKQLSTTYFE